MVCPGNLVGLKGFGSLDVPTTLNSPVVLSVLEHEKKRKKERAIGHGN